MARAAKVIKRENIEDVGSALGKITTLLRLQAVVQRAHLAHLEGKVDTLASIMRSSGAGVSGGAAQRELAPMGTTFDASPMVNALSFYLKGGKSAVANKNMAQDPLIFVARRRIQGLNNMVLHLTEAVTGPNSLSTFGEARNIATVVVNGRSWDGYSNSNTTNGMVTQVMKNYKEGLVKLTRQAVAACMGDGTFNEVKPSGGDATRLALEVFLFRLESSDRVNFCYHGANLNF